MQERLGFLPAGLTALSRNVCDWRPGWGSQLTVLCAGLKDGVCGVSFLLDEGRVLTLDLQHLPNASYHNIGSLYICGDVVEHCSISDLRCQILIDRFRSL